MAKQTTEGVSITVETLFQEEHSKLIGSEYFFSYKITIHNSSEFPIQLLSRFWNIVDSNGQFRFVEGQGVVGKQPIIEPGDSYQYVSGVDLQTEIGKMYGEFRMENKFNKRLFTVNIPEFKLITPFKLN